MNLNPIAGIIEAVGSVAGDLITTDKERMQLDIAAYEAETKRFDGQIQINVEEAKSASLFVSGWRPAVGWCCVLALAYQFLFFPLAQWSWATAQAAHLVSLGLVPPPALDTSLLMTLVTGMLGIGGLRSFDKMQGTSK